MTRCRRRIRTVPYGHHGPRRLDPLEPGQVAGVALQAALDHAIAIAVIGIRSAGADVYAGREWRLRAAILEHVASSLGRDLAAGETFETAELWVRLSAPDGLFEDQFRAIGESDGEAARRHAAKDRSKEAR